MTLSLRSITARDAAFLDSCVQALLEGGYELDERSGAGLLAQINATGAEARIVERDGASCGVIAWRAMRRDASAFAFVAVPRAETRRGLGRSAVELAEAEMRDAGARTAYAPASERHGIAVYFWIRLGYRPLLSGDWPCAREGVAWLSRALG